MIKPLTAVTAATTAIAAGVAIAYNVNAVVHDTEFRSLAAFANDIVLGGGAAAIAGVAGLACISPKARPVAKFIAGIGGGAAVGALAGIIALVAANHVKGASAARA